MKPTHLLALVVGIVATAVGLLLFYGCLLGTGIACPAATFQTGGLILLVAGEAVFMTGILLVAVVRMGPAPPRASRRPVDAAPTRKVPPNPEAARPALKADPRAQLFFCPTCGKRYRTVSGRFCPEDATELRPLG